MQPTKHFNSMSVPTTSQLYEMYHELIHTGQHDNAKQLQEMAEDHGHILVHYADTCEHCKNHGTKQLLEEQAGI
jgi:hypothetical protein